MAVSPTRRELADRLQEPGCVLTELSGEITSPAGEFAVMFATNPANGRFVNLPMIPDDDIVTPWVVGHIERRLILKTGFASL